LADLPEAVLVVIRRGERFLMIRRAAHLEVAPGHWTPAGGRVEPGESQEQAVVREIAEEVGLEVRAERQLGDMISEDGRYRLNWWSASVVAGDAHAACDEVDEVRWVTLDEMRALEPSFAADLEVFERLSDPPG